MARHCYQNPMIRSFCVTSSEPKAHKLESENNVRLLKLGSPCGRHITLVWQHHSTSISAMLIVSTGQESMDWINRDCCHCTCEIYRLISDLWSLSRKLWKYISYMRTKDGLMPPLPPSGEFLPVPIRKLFWHRWPLLDRRRQC
jgi:hypothetical protein